MFGLFENGRFTQDLPYKVCSGEHVTVKTKSCLHSCPVDDLKQDPASALEKVRLQVSHVIILGRRRDPQDITHELLT